MCRRIPVSFAAVSLALILLAPAHAKSLLAPPLFASIGAENENAALTMTCKGDAPYRTLECRFSQVTVSKKSAEEVQKELDVTKKEILAATDKTLEEQKQRLCNAVSEMGQATSPEKKAFEVRARETFNRFCACTARNCFVETSQELVRTRMEACSIRNHDFSLSFRKINERKWISNPGPQGLCNAVTVTTIEHDPGKTYLWNYTQTRVTGDTEGELCKHLQINVPLKYSWKFASELSMRCDTIRFD